ncbi:prolipoprotein diacylglyceryl transferase [Planctomyces sp. SH-PL62]|uniref:prolipoprotein diacylglyceryl transferase n=1 Tax=Planctomyces sp. SH-PL62 TaxID=1636152 RepID=UPI00078B399A|nr:prolipoprotein diacylglyceryl transferase [Planctomyces sp. SH-PL62]AMV39043.1 Prolipoprotein diacylglyceryl transferase [Planctomyces sp. SH-PL62]
MRQVLFTIPIFGGVKVFGYGAMLVLAFASSTWLAVRRARREKLDADLVMDMAFWLFAGGLIGARLFYCIQYWGRGIDGVLDVFQFWKGGIVYYGGIFGGVAAFFLYRWINRFPVRPYIDLLAPSIAVGTLFGRLGCFLNGCCFGDVCRSPFGVQFPQGSPPWETEVRLGLIPADALHSLSLHPTQIYSALDALVLLILLSAYYPLRRRDGEVMGILMITYPITRTLIEYLRNDEGIFFLGLTISQTISLGLLLGAAAYWFWLSRTPKGRYSDTIPTVVEAPALTAAT